MFFFFRVLNYIKLSISHVFCWGWGIYPCTFHKKTTPCSMFAWGYFRWSLAPQTSWPLVFGSCQRQRSFLMFLYPSEKKTGKCKCSFSDVFRVSVSLKDEASLDRSTEGHPHGFPAGGIPWLVSMGGFHSHGGTPSELVGWFISGKMSMKNMKMNEIYIDL